MIALKNAGLRAVALLLLQTLWLETAYAESSGGQKFNEEVSKQESIYQSREERPEGYTVDRSLVDYTETLSPELDRTLQDLGPKDRWLDIGAGTGQAILDYYAPKYDLLHPEGRERRGRKAQAVAISIEDRRTPVWRQTAASLAANQIRYLYNRRLREYSSEELGRFQVITDVIGGFSYTTNLSRFVENVLALLELDGSFYTVLQDVHSQDGTNKPYYEGSPFLTQIANADGSEVKLCSWLKSIACVEVTCELKTAWKPPIEAYRIHKVCNNTSVPVLTPTHYEAGTPPERRFKLGN